MVRRWLLIGLLALSPTPALGQAVDWTRSGGDLFGRLPEPPGLGDDDAREAAVVAVPDQPYAEAIRVAALRHGIDAKLLHALVVVESGYRPDARSPVGAGGLTQLMPATALELGVTDRFDVNQNLIGGADYLARQLNRFGDVRLALAAYNAGPGRVARLGRIPDIEETRTYVVRVVDCYLALTAGRGVRHARDCAEPGARP